MKEQHSERTQAILDMTKELQDITATVRQIRDHLEAEKRQKESTREQVYRLIKEGLSLLFPDKRAPKPIDNRANRGNMPKAQ